ncbi:MAG TPA: globin domain-containing protein [Anaerolineales bacterium]
MNIEQVQLVRDSLIHVRPIADEIAESFYSHLFEIGPHLRKLFTGNMKTQGAMLMTSLELAVSGLDDMESILPAVQALGERHMSYGVKKEYYRYAKESFLWALEKHLNDEFTPTLKAAWSEAFDTLIEAMSNAADS